MVHHLKFSYFLVISVTQWLWVMHFEWSTNDRVLCVYTMACMVTFSVSGTMPAYVHGIVFYNLVSLCKMFVFCFLFSLGGGVHLEMFVYIIIKAYYGLQGSIPCISKMIYNTRYNVMCTNWQKTLMVCGSEHSNNISPFH